jgi:hypothetical protein
MRASASFLGLWGFIYGKQGQGGKAPLALLAVDETPQTLKKEALACLTRGARSMARNSASAKGDVDMEARQWWVDPGIRRG